MKRSTLNLAIAISLILIGVSLRLLPHPANFAPVAAIAIFGGSILPWRLGVWVPLAAMAASDAIIGFHSLIAVTWGCYLLIALASSHWLRKRSFFRGAFLTVSSSIFFFVVTNFAVWLSSGMYAHTWAGLARSYELALPFFRNTLLSDMIYTAALFGVYVLVARFGSRIFKTKSVTSNL